MKKRTKVHRLPTRATSPREVPDCNRPISSRGASPGGLPPRGIQPGWNVLRARSFRDYD